LERKLIIKRGDFRGENEFSRKFNIGSWKRLGKLGMEISDFR
jgi:hypothetical protein